MRNRIRAAVLSAVETVRPKRRGEEMLRKFLDASGMDLPFSVFLRPHEDLSCLSVVMCLGFLLLEHNTELEGILFS